MRQELLNWTDVDHLIDALLPQLTGDFDAILMITRGGIVPGGLISEALDIKVVLTAAVDFPLDIAQAKLLAWPEFLQFPDESLLAGGG
jgi:hypoxanthine phosphoribosyltransferase